MRFKPFLITINLFLVAGNVAADGVPAEPAKWNMTSNGDTLSGRGGIQRPEDGI